MIKNTFLSILIDYGVIYSFVSLFALIRSGFAVGDHNDFELVEMSSRVN
jgi:hypothetical protein